MTTAKILKVSLAVIGCAFGAMLFIGCASPGTPQPPSLHLPRPVSDLQAQRLGDSVQLRWTMPDDTTDALDLVGQRRVIVCRRAGVSLCQPVKEFPEMPKAKVTIDDALPATLTTGVPALLTYEVQVLSPAGRSAGPSNDARTASGAAPAVVSTLRARVTEKGVVLRWEKSPDGAEPGTEIVVKRERAQETAAPKKTASRNPLAAKNDVPVQNLRVRTDAGGTLDGDAAFGAHYRYTAQRVRHATLDKEKIDLFSAPSETVDVDVRDVFPPQIPQGLVAADPMRTADGSYVVDLSWEPNTENDLAGYSVYRRDMTALTPMARVNGQLAVPALHDSGLLRGHAYAYSVSAMDKSGNESKHSAVVEVDVPDR